MKTKPICEFNHGICPNRSTVKWGDHWFCNEHAGDRAKVLPNDQSHNRRPTLGIAVTAPAPIQQLGEPGERRFFQ